MRSSSRPLPNMPSSFLTAGGGPLDLPLGSICSPGKTGSVCVSSHPVWRQHRWCCLTTGVATDCRLSPALCNQCGGSARSTTFPATPTQMPGNPAPLALPDPSSRAQNAPGRCSAAWCPSAPGRSRMPGVWARAGGAHAATPPAQPQQLGLEAASAECVPALCSRSSPHCTGC